MLWLPLGILSVLFIIYVSLVMEIYAKYMEDNQTENQEDRTSRSALLARVGRAVRNDPMYVLVALVLVPLFLFDVEWYIRSSTLVWILLSVRLVKTPLLMRISDGRVRRVVYFLPLLPLWLFAWGSYDAERIASAPPNYKIHMNDSVGSYGSWDVTVVRMGENWVLIQEAHRDMASPLSPFLDKPSRNLVWIPAHDIHKMESLTDTEKLEKRSLCD